MSLREGGANPDREQEPRPRASLALVVIGSIAVALLATIAISSAATAYVAWCYHQHRTYVESPQGKMDRAYDGGRPYGGR